jgi:hypothetical protein
VNVEFRIEELVLYGFPPGDHHRIGDAAEHELSRLFAEKGVPPSLDRTVEVPSLDAGSFEMTQGPGSAAVGEQIARSLYAGMTR